MATAPTAKPAGEAALQITAVPVAIAADQAAAQVRRHALRQRGGDAVEPGRGAGRRRCIADLGDQVQADAVLLDIDDSSAARAAARDRGPARQGARRRGARPRAAARQHHLAAGVRVDADRRGGGRGAARLAERQPASTSACARRSPARWPSGWCRSASTCAPARRCSTWSPTTRSSCAATCRSASPRRSPVGQPVQIRVDAYPDDRLQRPPGARQPGGQRREPLDHRSRPRCPTPAGAAQARLLRQRQHRHARRRPGAGGARDRGDQLRRRHQALRRARRRRLRAPRAHRHARRAGPGRGRSKACSADEVVATSGLAKLENGMAVAVRKGDG